MSTGNFIDAIPAEIIDAIVDLLHTDRRAIVNCSTISSKWLPASRHHIFSEVTFHPLNLDSFLSLLQSQSSYGTILPYIHRVVLTNIVWSHLDARSRTSFLEYCAQFIELVLYHVVFESFTNAIEVISAFRSLEVLTLDKTWWASDRGGDEVTVFRASPLHLRTLYMRDCNKCDILEWLLLLHESTRMPAVENVNLGIVVPIHFSPIGNFLRQLGSSLNRLQFGFSAMNTTADAEQFYTEIDLAHNTSLRSITIDELVFPFQLGLRGAVDWIPLILSQITPDPPHLEEVQFNLIPGMVFNKHDLKLDPADFPLRWREYDRMFVKGERFKVLKKVYFRAFGKVDGDAAEMGIRKLFPLCDAKSLLCFA